MGPSPGGRGADERAVAAAVVVDDEAVLLFPPREISFRNSRHGGGDGDDKDTAPSELSSLVSPSALTPCYGLSGYDSELHRSQNRDVRPSLIHLHPTAASDSHLQLNVIEGARKSFRLVLWLGLLSVGVLLGADVEYIVFRRAQPSSGKAEVSQNSIVPSAAASVYGAGTEPVPAAGSHVNAEASKRGKAKKTKTGKDGGGREKASKRGKANKTKTGKDDDDDEDKEDKEAPATDIAKWEGKANGEEDEIIVNATVQDRPALVADNVSNEWRREETTAVPEARDSWPG